MFFFPQSRFSSPFHFVVVIVVVEWIYGTVEVVHMCENMGRREVFQQISWVELTHTYNQKTPSSRANTTGYLMAYKSKLHVFQTYIKNVRIYVFIYIIYGYMTHIYEQKHFSTSASSKHNSLSKLRRRPKGYWRRMLDFHSSWIEVNLLGRHQKHLD